MVLWNWFAVPAFHLSEISFWIMYGLILLVKLFQSPGDIEAEHRHKIVAVMLNACVPAEKRQEVTEQLKGFEDRIRRVAGWKQVFAKIFSNSIRSESGLSFIGLRPEPCHRFPAMVFPDGRSPN